MNRAQTAIYIIQVDSTDRDGVWLSGCAFGMLELTKERGSGEVHLGIGNVVEELIRE